MTDKTLGAYERTVLDPDDMDGGVTAAKIEEEVHHERHDAATRNTVANAVADGLVGPGEWMPLSVRYRVAAKVLDALREKHDAPVRECPGPDQHCDIDPMPIIDEVARLDGELHDARTMAALWKETARRLSKRAHGLGWERDQHQAGEEEAEARAEKDLVEALARMDRTMGRWQVAQARAAEPRPFTPNDITDEMVERVWQVWSQLPPRDMHSLRIALTAALTVPTRPEWEDAPAVVATSTDYEGHTDERAVWVSRGEGRWARHGGPMTAPSSSLSDVTPLYPEGVRVEGSGR